MKIMFGGHEFLMHTSGALYWTSKKMLIVSDLHLEKGSHFALKGFFLPPYDSHHTLSLLRDICAETNCTRLLLLGDSFHDDKGYARLGDKDRDIFDRLKKHEPIWIQGNHDRDFVPDGFSGMSEYWCDGIVFRHEAAKNNDFEISGHFHPKVEINRSLSRPCFVESGQKIIMPSFGAYTGGLLVTDSAFANVLESEKRIYALGGDRVYAVAAERQPS